MACLIETQRAVATSGRAAQAGHWQAAHDWFAASVPRYQRLLKTAKLTLPTQDARGYDQAVAGLARSNAALAPKP